MKVASTLAAMLVMGGGSFFGVEEFRIPQPKEKTISDDDIARIQAAIDKRNRRAAKRKSSK